MFNDTPAQNINQLLGVRDTRGMNEGMNERDVAPWCDGSSDRSFMG